jgi:hypothetical protein
MDASHENVHVARLAQVIESTSLEGLARRILVAVTGQKYDPAMGLHGQNARQCLVTVQAGHAHIQQYDIGVDCLQQFEDLVSTSDQGHHEAFMLQNLCYAFPKPGFIVSDNNMWSAQRHSP